MVVTVTLLVLIGEVFMKSAVSIRNEEKKALIESVISQLNQVARQQRSNVFSDAIRDEAFAFLRGAQKGPLKRAPISRNSSSGQDYLLLFDRQKNPFAWVLLSPGEEQDGRLPDYLQPDEIRHTGLLLEGKTSSVLLPALDGFLLLSAHPVTRADGSGPSPGWLVYGLGVGKDWFERMRELTGVVVTPVVDAKSRDVIRQPGKTLSTDALGQCRISLPSSHSGDLPAEIRFENALGEVSPLGLQLAFPPARHSGIDELRDKLTWGIVSGAIVLSIFFCLVIEHLFIKKILRMDREFQVLVREKDSSTRLREISNDEFGRLATSANQLLDSLRRQRMESDNQNTLFLSVLDSASEGIMAFRSLRNEKGAISDFVLVLANKSAELMLNRRARDMLGKCLLGLFPANISEGLFERYVRVVESRTGEQFEAFLPYEEIKSWFHISAEPWVDGFVVTFEEIGQRKRVEQELKASIEELERFNRAMIGRENRVLEMKSEVNLLRTRLGLPPGYKVDSLSNES